MKTLIIALIALLLVACSKERSSYQYAQSSFLRLCEEATLSAKADTTSDIMTFSATCKRAK